LSGFPDGNLTNNQSLVLLTNVMVMTLDKLMQVAEEQKQASKGMSKIKMRGLILTKWWWSQTVWYQYGLNGKA